MLLRGVLSTVLLVSFALSARSAPRTTDRPDGPPVIGQAVSWNVLVDTVKKVIRQFAGPLLSDKLDKEMLRELDPKQIPGFDPRRKFGAYAELEGDLEKSSLILMIPVADQKEFTASLVRIDVKIGAEKDADGAYPVNLSEFPMPVAVKFVNDYAYFCIGNAKALAKPRPVADVIDDKDPTLSIVNIRLDRIPKEFKNMAIGLLREQVEAAEELADPQFKEVVTVTMKYLLRTARQVLEQGRDVTVLSDFDFKTGESYYEVLLDGQPKSVLKDDILARAKAPPHSFGSLLAKPSIGRAFVSAPAFSPEIRDVLAKLIEVGQKSVHTDGLGGAPQAAIELFDAVCKSAITAAKDGSADLGVVARSAKDGTISMLGGIRIGGSDTWLKSIKELVDSAPDDIKGAYKFSVAKIGDRDVHEIDFAASGLADLDKLQAVFGKDLKFRFVLAKEGIYASFGTDGMKNLEEAIAAKPEPTRAAEISVNGKALANLIEKMAPPPSEKQKKTMEAMLKQLAAIDRIVMAGADLEGGEKLRVRFGTGYLPLVGLFGVFAAGTFEMVEEQIERPAATNEEGKKEEPKKEADKKDEPKNPGKDAPKGGPKDTPKKD